MFYYIKQTKKHFEYKMYLVQFKTMNKWVSGHILWTRTATLREHLDLIYSRVFHWVRVVHRCTFLLCWFHSPSCVNVACVSGSSIRFFSVFFIIYSLPKILKCLTGFSWLTVGLLIIIARSPFTCQSQFPFRWQSYRHQILHSRKQYLIWKNFKDPAFTKTLTLNW